MIDRNDLWYKDAIIYSLDVETYQDSDGDGVGDFRGLTRRLDYIASLGINCIWLLPFYPTPNRDNGYDVADYFGVDPRLGSLGDFVDFIRGATERGIRVIIDLVVNHTSIDHPWFQKARSDPDSRYRDFYVWSSEEPANAQEGMIFPGVQERIWTYDEVAGEWYLHRFFEHQPDLNIANPEVREEIRKVIGFWLELGVSGFRIDAAPFLVELKGFKPADIERYAYGRHPHDFIEKIREFLQWRSGSAILLAEANVPMDEVPQYFGDGDRMHLLFHFTANQQLFLALARGEAQPIIDGLTGPQEIPAVAQWAHFLRNHDELDLGRLTGRERDEVFEAMDITDDMVLFGRGPRRRLPPMLGGDRARLELAYSLLLAMPGTPIIRYGEEIGMGDMLELEGRSAVRTVMQWTDRRGGGFSTAEPERFARPVIAEGEYGYGEVNVFDQRGDDTSFLSWMQRMIRIRRSCPELGWGALHPLESGDPGVLALAVALPSSIVVTLHNLTPGKRVAILDLSRWEGMPIHDLLERGERQFVGPDERRVGLPGWGYRWFRIGRDDTLIGWD